MRRAAPGEQQVEISRMRAKRREWHVYKIKEKFLKNAQTEHS
jgi:hypothetical protein